MDISYYDPTKSVKNVPVEVRLMALERLVKNIYHCEDIVYDVALPEEGTKKPSELYGSIYMVNLNDDPLTAPKLNLCCDGGISYEVFGQIVESDYRPETLEILHGLEIWFGYDATLAIKEMEKEKKNESLPSK